MASRAKRKKEYRAEHGIVKKPKKRLGGYKDCCGNCNSRLGIFKQDLVKCNNKDSQLFRAIMPKSEYCTAHVH